MQPVGLGMLYSHIACGCVAQIYNQRFGAEYLSGIVIDHSPTLGILRKQNAKRRRTLIKERLAVEDARPF
jgi:hypothetical protein